MNWLLLALALSACSMPDKESAAENTLTLFGQPVPEIWLGGSAKPVHPGQEHIWGRSKHTVLEHHPGVDPNGQKYCHHTLVTLHECVMGCGAETTKRHDQGKVRDCPKIQ